MITVLIPLYNKASLISRTLDSVRQQTFTQYEVVIVDDGSTDGSHAVVQAYLATHGSFATRVRVIQQPNQGVSAARNRGMAASNNDWVAFLDADDQWHASYLQRLYDMTIQYPDCQVFGTAYTLVTAPGKSRPAVLHHLPRTNASCRIDQYFVVATASAPPLSSSSTMVSRRALQAIGGFPPGIGAGEDLLTWARLALHCNLAYDNHPLATIDRDPRDFNEDQRNRMPDMADTVGQALHALLQAYPQVPGLKSYVGKWYKMRTHIYLAAGQRKAAFQEWRRWGRYEQGGYKRWAFLLLIFLPFKYLR
ncbi:Glycosyl transferase family 2 [Chitinophaga costaii]|uniref:Glycosyl transferase family 2 n=1 Tax=Chitinophaga costaii TaxID=1335309 RepID=A0A1C3ZB04_9BACT|nr:glycosyltransferase family A protein [Chitinophaga costaii]PUZ30301.1 glycosyl transferase [Chitinophaga costaii]SCB79564.1 Glycosyl transferase family 2 [Chitinophaga costaii]